MNSPQDLQVDEFLDHLNQQRMQAPAYVRQRIMASLPQQSSLNDWFGIFNWLAGSPWRSATAMLIPIVLGFSAGLYTPDRADTDATESFLYADNLEEYDDHEI